MTIREKYSELARQATLKSKKISSFFNELSSLIFKDMRKAATEKIRGVIQKGNDAVNSIGGNFNIRKELESLVKGLSVPIENITVSLLEDYLLRLRIISFAADIDIFSYGEANSSLFDSLRQFQNNLTETVEFYRTLIMPDTSSVLECTKVKIFQDIAYQGNILFFYTKGEVSQKGITHLLSDEQKARFNIIFEKIDSFITFTHKASDESAYSEIAKKLLEIKSDMTREADILKGHGGGIRFLANEYGFLADRVSNSIP